MCIYSYIFQVVQRVNIEIWKMPTHHIPNFVHTLPTVKSVKMYFNQPQTFSDRKQN